MSSSGSGSRNSRRTIPIAMPQPVPAPIGQGWNVTEKKVIAGRKLAFPEEQNQLVLQQLSRVGWQYLNDGLVDYYHEGYVREFYHSMRLTLENNNEHRPMIISYINGREIRLNISFIATALNIPDHGDTIFFISSKEEMTNAIGDLYDDISYKHTFMKPEYANRNHKSGRMYEKHLKPELQNLNSFIDVNILPSMTTNNSVSKYQQFILHCIVTGRRLNLPYIMIRSMYAMATVMNKSLGYGAYLTRMFTTLGIHMNQQNMKKLPLALNKRTLKLRSSHPYFEDEDEDDEEQGEEQEEEEEEEEEQQQYEEENYANARSLDELHNTQWFQDY